MDLKFSEYSKYNVKIHSDLSLPVTEKWKNLQNNTFTLIQFRKFNSRYPIEEKSIVLDQNGNKIEDEDIISHFSIFANYVDWW